MLCPRREHQDRRKEELVRKEVKDWSDQVEIGGKNTKHKDGK
jgi:hypothetical protein